MHHALFESEPVVCIGGFAFHFRGQKNSDTSIDNAGSRKNLVECYIFSLKEQLQTHAGLSPRVLIIFLPPIRRIACSLCKI
jgi:hypothetical protein